MKDKYYIAGSVMCFLAGVLGAEAYARHFNGNRIPKVDKVQQDCIAPSRLEIKCTDFDGNGEPETQVFIANDKGNKIPYLLREVDGKPVLSPYEVKPAEVIYK